MKKVQTPSKEWSIPAPWGNIALISWGDATKSPVLLVHGRADSASTFIPLLELLPDDYYYVAIDLPGCGKSDAFPIGVMLMRFTNVVAVDIVVRHLRWMEFIYIGHSLGTEIGCFYNAIYPNKITKFILLDPLPAWLKIQVKAPADYFKSFHEAYYKNYKKQNSHDRLYTREQAERAVGRARGVARGAAGALLARSLWPAAGGMYRLSWDRRQMTPAPLNLEDEYYIKLFSANCPPTLVINATNVDAQLEGREKILELMEKIRDRVKKYTILTVDGDHDLHFKAPERFINEVLKFLKSDCGCSKAKL